MLRKNKAFSGVLTSIKGKSEDETVSTVFTIRHVEEGDSQIFLNSYADICKQENVESYMRYPIMWKTVRIEAGYKFHMEFDEVEFECILRSIGIGRTFKKGIEVFTYTLTFEKELESDNDMTFMTYLNQKELGDDGRKRLIDYSVYLKPIESVGVQ